jgi:hypothetical protein
MLARVRFQDMLADLTLDDKAAVANGGPSKAKQ